MRKYIIGFVAGMVIGGIVAQAATPADLYRQFGPKLIDAVARAMKDEINILRAEHGLPARTNEQMVNAIDAKLGTITNYPWMASNP